jgi:DNA polymerase III delta prime subunit
MNNIFLSVVDKINKGEEISPFLLVGKNLEIINSQTETLAKSLLKEYDIPNVYLYILKDNNENLKIKDVKEFVLSSNIKTPYKFQIFFIENISRLTLASSNSLLKFFEEP